MLWGCGDGEHCAEGACAPPPEPTGLSFRVAKPCEPNGGGRGAGSVYTLRVEAPRGTRFLVLYGPHRGRNALSAGLGFKVPQAAARCGGAEIHLGSAGLKVGDRVVKQVEAKQKVRVVTKEPFVEKALCGGLHFQLVNLDTCTATSAVAGREGAEGREQPCPSIHDGRADADFGESLAFHSPRVVNGAGTRGWCVAGEGRPAGHGDWRERLTRPPSYPWMASFLDPHPEATQENGLSNPAFCGGAVVNDKVGARWLHARRWSPGLTRGPSSSSPPPTACSGTRSGATPCSSGTTASATPRAAAGGPSCAASPRSRCIRSELRGTTTPYDTCGSGGRRPGLTRQQVPEDPGGVLRQSLQARHRRRRAGRPDQARLVHLSAEADAPEQARGRRHRLRARGARLVDVPAGQPAGGAIDREARQVQLLVLPTQQDALPRREGHRGKGQHVLRGESRTALLTAPGAHAWPALTQRTNKRRTLGPPCSTRRRAIRASSTSWPASSAPAARVARR